MGGVRIAAEAVAAQKAPEASAPAGTATPASTAAGALGLQRSIGNRALTGLLQRGSVTEAAAPGAPKARDELDDFLISRLELFDLQIAGTEWHVTISSRHKWTSRYTQRVLALAAMTAAIRRVFGRKVSLTSIRLAHDGLVGKAIRYDPGEEGRRTVIEDSVMESMREALGLSWSQASATWRERIMLARFLDGVLRMARDSWHELRPHLSDEALSELELSPNTIFRMLDDPRVRGVIIEVAKHHRAARPLVAVFQSSSALRHGGREVTSTDTAHLSRPRWAGIVAALAGAAQLAGEEARKRRDEELRLKGMNEYLMPHQIDVEDAAAFVVKNYEPGRGVHLRQSGLDVRGGMRLKNVRGEPIFLLRVDSSEVIFQNETDLHFYRQSIPGFEEEQKWGVFTQVAEETQPIVWMTDRVLGVTKALYPPLGGYILAHTVLATAGKAAEHWEEIDDAYRSLRIAWNNIDDIAPGLLGAIKDAVLDPDTMQVINFDNTDWGAWFDLVLKLLRRAIFSLKAEPAKAAGGLIRKALRIFFAALKRIGQTVTDLLPVLWGSKNIDPLAAVERAQEVIEEKLTEFGVADAAILAIWIASLSREDYERLAREAMDAVEHGMELWRLIGKITQ